MGDEHGALIKTRMGSLVPRPKSANMIRCMWLYRHKFNATCTGGGTNLDWGPMGNRKNKGWIVTKRLAQS